MEKLKYTDTNDELLNLIVNKERINDNRYLNKYFENINKALKNGGIFKGNVETYSVRRNRILKKFPLPFNRIYLFFDTLLVRVFPKLKITKNLYFYITKGKGRVLSKAETYGRLYSCGFEIIEEKYKNNRIYFSAKKVKKPIHDNKISYGFLIKLKRLGKNGKLINVYKIRTMYAFSEYLQEYIYNQNSLQDGGKINKDFRVTPQGRILRKFWIDEIPMLINILKGDIKLVGVRPLSQHYFSLYTKELQDLRNEFKPGFIPPFYVDLPKNLNEIMESEMRYLKLYKQSKFKTDIKYFFLAFKSVLFRGVRSS